MDQLSMQDPSDKNTLVLKKFTWNIKNFQIQILCGIQPTEVELATSGV